VCFMLDMVFTIDKMSEVCNNGEWSTIRKKKATHSYQKHEE